MTSVPPTLFCLMVGSKYYCEPPGDGEDDPAILPVFLDYEQARLYRDANEPFQGSILSAVEVDGATLFEDVKKFEHPTTVVVIELDPVLVHAEYTTVFDPRETVH